MSKQFICGGTLFCFALIISSGFGQSLNLEPFVVKPSPRVAYVDEGGFFPPSPDGTTNFIRIFTRGLNYGDKVRLRTVGTFAVRQPGQQEFGSEGAEPFLGLLTGVPLRPNRYFLPAKPPRTGLPQYVTPSIEIKGKSVPTDIENDFLITPGGVTLPCIPLEGNFFVFLNPDPRVLARDVDEDFGIEVTLLEGARLSTKSSLNATNVTVGDQVTITLTLTNWGNVPTQKIEMYDLHGPGTDIGHDSNLVQRVSGPNPRGFSSLPAGGSGEIKYVYRTISPGTNNWFSRVGLTVCDDQFYPASGGAIPSLVIKPIIEVTPRKPSLEIYTETSLKAGEANTEAPLRFSVDENVLTTAPEFSGRGLIADGVTPLLFRLEIAPDQLDRFENEATLRLEAKVISGKIGGTPIQDRLETLKDGDWNVNGEVIVSKDKPVAHAALKALLSDELEFAARQVEVIVRIDVRDQSGLIVGTMQLLIRRPPIVLTHGYNTDGNWGEDFLKELKTSRGTSIIQVAKYGLEETTSPSTGGQAAINTVWPLRNLAPLAERAFDKALETVRQQWLFTRYDVVAHSQGGLLSRMLCTLKKNNHLPLPYRNEENYFRGRFHRVVTIGSPHNGTRLVRYLLSLNQNDEDAVPSWIGYGMVGGDLAQDKFDPWGEDIQELNDTEPGAKWVPDPAAQFHLVRTVVNGGNSFSADVRDCPALWALGIDSPAAGAILADEGSDGVVDYGSMLARSSFTDPANGYTVPEVNRISHAFYDVAGIGEIFGATSGQVLSVVVARHVMSALNQSDQMPASERIFDSFQVPRLLHTKIRDAIDELARSFDSESTEPEFSLSPFASASRGTSEGLSAAATLQTFTLRLVPPEGRPVTNQILWSAQLFGTNGITSKGISVPARADRLEVQVRVDPGVYGDVVLEGMYKSTNGTRVVLKPYLVASLVPAGVTAQSFEVVPQDPTRHPAGVAVPIEVWTTWSDGRKSRRFITAKNLRVASSKPNVVDVSNPLVWRTGVSGEARITTTFDGKTYVSTWTVFDPDGSELGTGSVALSAEKNRPSEVVLSWPAANSAGFKLQFSDSLSADANWQNIIDVATQVGDRLQLLVPSNSSVRFYRLQKLP